MYNEKIDTTNKIIPSEVLVDIFDKMNEIYKECQNIYKKEERENERIAFHYQEWTFKDIASRLYYKIYFKDNNSIEFENYQNFLSIYNSRLEEIDSLNCYFTLHYGIKNQESKEEYIDETINLYITEEKVEIRSTVDNKNEQMIELYNYIKERLNGCPKRYDAVIRKKRKVYNTVTISSGLIPAMVISTLIGFIPTIQTIYKEGIVIYPIFTMMICYVIGSIIANTKLDPYYEKIVPKKKYEGYSSSQHKSIYKDDIEKYVSTSEVLIGKNIHNLKCRKSIKKIYSKYKKKIPMEFIILALLSLIWMVLKIII